MTLSPERLPALWLFLGAYLHQDWREDYESTYAAFEDFLRAEPQRTRDMTLELQTVLGADLDEPDLSELLKQAGSFYLPASDGLTVRAWLARLADRGPQDPTSR